MQRAKISGLVEFVLQREGVKFKVQIIMLWSGYRTGPMEVARSVISTFDISVCKVALVSVPSEYRNLKFYFQDSSDFVDIQRRRFVMHLRVHDDTEKAFGRMQKYFKRGFRLHKLFFADLGYVASNGKGMAVFVPYDSRKLSLNGATHNELF